MKNFYKPNNDYYQDTSREFNATTRSMAQKRHHLSSSKVSDHNKSKFSQRIEKACPTNSLQAYKKQVTLLKKQLQRLQKDNLKKDHRIFEIQSSYTLYRQLESELQETYRIIYMYQGKIQQLQKQLKRLQHKVADKIQSNFTAQQIQTLLNQYQDDNTEMQSTIEGQNRIIIELEQRLRTVQSKYFQTSWKLSSQNRVLTNPLKKKFPKLRDTIVIQEMSLSQRQKLMNDLQNKYHNLTAQKSKDDINGKSFRYTNQKFTINNSQEKQFKNSRFINSWQTPISPIITSSAQNISQNYKIEKIHSSPKVSTKENVKELQPKRETNKINYDSPITNENRKSQLTLSENPSVSLNYSLSQGPTISQRSGSPRNVISTAYGLTSSNVGQSINYNGLSSNSNFSISQGGYVLQNTGGSQTRILSNSKVISGNRSLNNNIPQAMIHESKQTSRKSNTYQHGQNPQSPSSRIIRVSRQKIQPASYSQNKQSVTTYYQGSTSMTSGEPQESKKIRYVMRQAS